MEASEKRYVLRIQGLLNEGDPHYLRKRQRDVNGYLAAYQSSTHKRKYTDNIVLAKLWKKKGSAENMMDKILKWSAVHATGSVDEVTVTITM